MVNTIWFRLDLIRFRKISLSGVAVFWVWPLPTYLLFIKSSLLGNSKWCLPTPRPIDSELINTFAKIDFHLLSKLNGIYDRGDSLPFTVESNGIPFGRRSKGKLSPRSYSVRFWKEMEIRSPHSRGVVSSLVNKSLTRREIITSDSCEIIRNMDCNYTYNIDLEPIGMCFGSKSIGKWSIQFDFGWFNTNQIVVFSMTAFTHDKDAHTDKSFRNLVNLSQGKIVIILFR